MTPTFRQPEFLSPTDEPIYSLRCPVHGDIRFSEHEKQIIDHPLFRRLGWIRQLALTEYRYPGATHSRSGHVLGVMEVATRMFDALARTHGALMETTFAQAAKLKDKPLAKARQILRLAALLHDAGHGCFSHAAEEVIHKGSDHESLTVTILTDASFLRKDLDRLFFKGCAELTANLIKSPKGILPQLQVLRDIISGQVDADRTDYLLRDSYYCGVGFGIFDAGKLIECLTLRENPAQDGRLEVAIRRDGIRSFGALILARYQMNTEVYYDQTRRIYDLYLKEYFKAKGGAEFDSPEKILRHNDVTMLGEIFRDADKVGEPAHPWALRIRDRRKHQLIYESDEDIGAAALMKVNAAFAKIKDEYPTIDFRLDEARGSIHKHLLPEDGYTEEAVPFVVLDTDGTADLLASRSPLLRKIPRWFRVTRIFADLADSNSSQQQKIAAKLKSYTKG